MTRKHKMIGSIGPIPVRVSLRQHGDTISNKVDNLSFIQVIGHFLNACRYEECMGLIRMTGKAKKGKPKPFVLIAPKNRPSIEQMSLNAPL
ncbi:hypothetical protein TorRG33x02_353000 [Trema orientale]|uniref:Uncharacterized protein n=1 Tax=Trema orientale TaxID=63057 RepID=A0A2P5ADG5_TREOI|nr:hypothetical protein TorRG33x02_353000 [Trema orientale]